MDTYMQALHKLIEDAFKEDVGAGDYSTLSTIPKDQKGKAFLKVKEAGILAGVKVAEQIFRYAQADVVFNQKMEDGAAMNFGDIAFTVEADVYTILTCERLVLNIMQRMSGIATLTHKYVQKLKGHKSILLDTRKTTPNFRLLEKEAVRIGGASNHRMGLYDMVMLKDNHIDYCGGVAKAINTSYDYLKKNNLALKIEVEARSLEDVQAALDTGKADRIMLDNFTPANIQQALAMIGGRCETEASGGINFDNLESYAATGVDFISSGAIIHQARSLDLSLKASIQ